MSTIQIRTLGRLELSAPDGEADPGDLLTRPKRAAVLAYLASARPYGPQQRDGLIGVFWPEVREERARRSLNQSVYVLRSILGEGAVTTRGGEIGLSPDLVWSDAVAFDAALCAGDDRTGLELHRGEFLQGFFLSGSPGFERWLDEEREHYRRRTIDAALRLAAEEEAAGHVAEATRWMRYAIELSPFEEKPLRRLLGFLVARGDQESAVRELERFSVRLRDELGLEVSEDVRNLVRGPPPTPVSRAPKVNDDRQAVGTSGGSESPAPPPGPSDVVGAESLPRSEKSSARRVRSGPLFALVVASLLVGGAGARLWLDRTPDAPSPVRARVLVAPFENRTDDPTLDPVGRIAADWITRGLIETGLVEVVPGALPYDDRSHWSTMGASVGATLIVTGSFQRDGAGITLTASVLDVERDAVLTALDPITTSASTPLPAIEQLRRRTAGALATIVDPRMAEWAIVASQPPSFESYRVFASGLELLEDEQYLAAGERFMDAAGRDSTFTSALVWAIEAFSLVGQGPRDSLALALAPRRDRLAGWDRAMLDYHLAGIRGNLGAEYEALRGLVRLTPTAAWQVLLARQALWLNRPGEALRILEQLEPENVRGIPQRMWWGTSLECLHIQGQYARELDLVRRWRKVRPRLPPYGELAELRALAGVGRAAEVVRYIDGQPRFRTFDWLVADRLRQLALELRVHGRPELAQTVLQRVFDLYSAAPDSVRRDPQARRQLGRSLFTAGRWSESRTVFEELLAEGHEPWIARGDLAIAAAKLGDRELAAEVEQWYADRAASYPTDKGWSTQWRARIVALLGERDRAVQLIAQAHAEGWPHWTWDELVEEYDGLRGYPPFEEVMRPQG